MDDFEITFDCGVCGKPMANPTDMVVHNRDCARSLAAENVRLREALTGFLVIHDEHYLPDSSVNGHKIFQLYVKAKAALKDGE